MDGEIGWKRVGRGWRKEGVEKLSTESARKKKKKEASGE